MKNIKKLISVFLVIVMIFSSVPLQGFDKLNLFDWLTPLTSAFDDQGEVQNIDLNTMLNSEETDFSKAPISDKLLDFESISEEARKKVGEIASKLFGNKENNVEDDQKPAKLKTANVKSVTSEQSESDITWSYDATTRTLTISGQGPMVDYVPDTDTGLIINTPWFSLRSEIETVVVEEGVTSIGDLSFALFANLKTAIIADTVESIGMGAFGYDINLTEIEFPESLKEIGDQAFCFCCSLSEAIIPEGVTTIAGGAFSFNLGLEKLSLPSTLTMLGEEAFSMVCALKEFESSLEFGDTIFTLEDHFEGCYALEKITNNSTTTIIDNNLGGSLDDVKYADIYAKFMQCQYKWSIAGGVLEELGYSYYYSEEDVIRDIVDYTNEKLGTDFNKDIEAVSEIISIIEEHVIDLPYAPYTVIHCKDDSAQHSFCKENIINHIVIGDDEKCTCFVMYGTIGDNVTWSCDAETGTLIFDGHGEMADFGDEAQYRLLGEYITNVEFKEGSAITSIADGAFYNLKNLTEITLPEGVTKIGEQCFYNSGIRKINLPSTLTDYSELSWYTGSTPLEEINVAEGNPALISYEGSLYSLIADDENIFDGDIYVLLKQPETKCGTFLNNTLVLNSCCFENYKTVTQINVPDSVIDIGRGAFLNCDSLVTINIGNSVVYETDAEDISLQISEGSVVDCDNLKNINVDKENMNYTSVDGVLYNKDITSLVIGPAGKSEIVLPESVAYVGEKFGLDGKGLEKVTILNPDCEIYDSASTINNNAIICSTKNSTAMTYADKYNRTFEYSDGIEITSIEVNADNAKTAYMQFETIDLTGITVTVNYSDGSSDVKTCGFTLKDATTDILGENEVTIDYRGKTDTFNVSVDCQEIQSFYYVTLYKGKETYSKYVPIKSGEYVLSTESYSGYEKTITVYDSEMNILSRNNYGEYEPVTLTYTYEEGKVYYIGFILDCTYASNLYIEFECNHNYVETIETQPTCGSNGYVTYICSYCGASNSQTIPSTAQHIDSNSDKICDVCSISLACGNDIIWSIDENGVLTISGTGDMTSHPWSTHRGLINSVVISEGITSICDDAFYNCDSLTEITIPASVTSIGYSSFYNCDNLKTVSFEENSQLQTIGNYAFEYCNKLSEITIPASVTSIGDSDFANCDNLKTVSFEENSQLQTIGNYAFEYCRGLTEITIPASVTSIGNYAFYDCYDLKTVLFADGSQLQTIGNSAFYNCDSLTGITIPASVTSVGECAFKSCNSLTTIYVEDGNMNYAAADGVLYNSDKTALIRYPAGKDTADFVVPASVTSIENYAFYYCDSLKTVTFAEGSQLLTIGNYAFYNCYDLTGITIPASVTSIGNYAFYDCYDLKTVLFADGSQLQTIGNYAFEYCNKLSEITIPASVTSVGDYSFYNCDKLTAINVEEGNIPYKSLNGVLYNADFTTLICCPAGVKSVEVPETVRRISRYAFYSSNLKEVTFLTSSFSWEYNYSFSSDVVIRCTAGSSGESFANNYNLNIEYFNNVSISTIEIDYANTKTAYIQFESFNTSDVSILVNYSDGTKATMNKDFSLSGNSTYDVGTHTVTVTYRGFSAEYDINVDYATITFNSSAYVRFRDDITTYVKYAPTTTCPLTYTCSNASDYTRTVTVCDSEMNELFSQSFVPGEYIEFTFNYEAGNTYYIGLSFESEYYGNVYVYFNCAHNYEKTIDVDRTCCENGRLRYTCIACGHQYTGTYYATAQHVDSNSDNKCDNCSISLACGDNLTWSIDENGVLTISGTGDMTSYPWRIHGAIIKSVVIPEGVTLICDEAFMNCYEITEITIPASVTYIGNGAFACNKLTEIDVEEGNEYYIAEDGVLYNSDKTALIRYPAGKDTADFVVPASVTSIENYAFYNCRSLTEITIPASVTSIGNCAFESCNNLKTVTFAEDSQLQTIGNCAFYNCRSLTEITIPASVTSIGNYAFNDCYYLKTVLFAEDSQLQTIGNYAFYNCDSITEITIPVSVTSIGSYAFYYCDSITEITIPASVTSIGNDAFGSCYDLKNVTFAEGSQLQTISDYAFRNCDSLTEITIPSSVTSIGYDAFYSCDNLKKITFLNPETNIYSDSGTIYNGATIYGYANSTAYAYAANYGRNFVELPCPHDNTTDYEEVSPDCLVNGTTAGTYCNFCKKWIVGREDIEALGHDETWVVDKPATCTSTGLELKYCARCEKFLVGDRICDSSTYPESPHEYGNSQTYDYSFSYPGAEKLVLKFSSNTYFESNYDYLYIYNKDGSLYGKYSGSSLASKTVEISGDSFTMRLTTDGSVTKYGFKFDSITAVGVYSEENSRETEALGHDFSDEWTVDLEPTCTVPGSKSHHCSRCDEKADVTEIEATGHSYESVVTEPTCTEQGFTTHTCSVCNDVYTDSEVEATGHSYGEMAEVAAPDCINTGLNEKICSACYDRQTEVLPALGHSPSGEWVIEVEPTCTEKGLEIQYCSRCENKLMSEIVCDPSAYPETPHPYGNSQTYSYTFSYPGAQKLVLKFSANTQVESVHDKIYIYKADGSLYGTYSDNQLASMEIELEGDSFAIKLTTDYSITNYGFSFDSIKAIGFYDDSCSRLVDELGHDLPEEWHVDLEPTCTSNGSNSKSCSRCDYVETDVVSALGHNAVAVPAAFPQQCDNISGDLIVKCTRCYEELVDENIPDFKKWRLVFKTSNGTSDENNSEFTVLYIKNDLSIGKYTQIIKNSDVFRRNSEYILDIECDGIPFGYIHKTKIASARTVEYTVLFETLDEQGNTLSVWSQEYTLSGSFFDDSVHTLSTQTQHNLVLDSVVREPSCSVKGEEKHICTVCDEEKIVETDTLPHNYISFVVDATCLDNGYTEHICDECSHSYRDTVTEAIGHNYEATHFEPEQDKDGYTLYKCLRCDANYTVLDPAVPVDGLYAVGETHKISLSWLKSVEASVTGYEVFRKAPEDEEYVKVKTINSRNTTSYVDKDVVSGFEYSYKVRALKDDVEGEFSEYVTAIALSDTTSPRVVKLEAIKAVRDTITGKVTFNINAEDDVGIVKYELFLKMKESSEWTLLEEKSGAVCSIIFDTRTVEDGVYDFKATAYDAAGNCDEVGITKQYMIDNTGPAKITGVSTLEVYASKATLSWNNTPEKDVHHFILRRVIRNGEDVSYEIVSDYITAATGYYLDNLTPGSTYTYCVAGVDEFGNTGEYSDEFTFTTILDTDSPYVNTLTPAPGRFNNVINFNVKCVDDYNIASITVQESFDGKEWSSIDSRSFNDICKQRSEKFTVSLTDIPEGAYYLRAIIKDSAGNVSTHDETSPYVQYYVDKTAPAKPTGLFAKGGDGYIEIKWNDSPETDRYNYCLYRSESAEGEYKLLKANISSLNYYDRNIERDKTYFYKLTIADRCGNVSEYSDVVSNKAYDDNKKPEIISIKPNSGTTIGDSRKSVGVKAYDNNMLSEIIIEYRVNDNVEFTVLDTISGINNSEGILNTQLPINGLNDGDKVYVRAYCKDVSGYIADYTPEYAYTVDKTAPSVRNIDVSAQGNVVTVSWKDNNESDIAGYYIYCSKNEGAYQSLTSVSKKSSHTYSYSATLEEGTYVYRIDAVDQVGNIASFYSQPHYIEKVNKIIAKIDTVSYFEVGVQERFSSEDSLSNNMIVSYNWDFGDGTTSSESNPVKSYEKAGTYMVTLTVTDNEGALSRTQKEITVKEREMLGTVKIRVYDNDGRTISGIPVYFDMGTDDQYILLTDRNGYVTTTMTAGFHEIGSYRYDNSGNKNYLPASVNVNVLAGDTVEEKLTLIEKDLITGKFEVREMTIDEILAAGIDPKAEENQQVYSVTVHLEYGEVPMVINYIRNDDGIIQQEGYVVPNSTGGGGTSGGSNEPINIPKFQWLPNDYGIEIITTLDIPVRASYLSQFFYATLYILNNADPGFKIVDCMTELDISPSEGLSIYSHTPIDIEIDGQQSSTATWILRGDEGGEYDLTATFKGTLEKFVAPVTAVFRESVSVRKMEETISMLVETPEYIFIEPADDNEEIIVSMNDEKNDPYPNPEDPEFDPLEDYEVAPDEAVIGNQYKYRNVAYYNIGMKNICDSSIYYPTVSSDAVTVKIDGKIIENAKTAYVKTVIEKDGVRTVVENPDNLQILNPGETLIAYYKVYDFEVIRPADHIRNNIEDKDISEEFLNEKLSSEDVRKYFEHEYVYQQLKDYFTFNSSNPAVKVDFNITNDLFYDEYFAKTDSDNQVDITYSTVEYGLNKTKSYLFNENFFKTDSRIYNAKLAELSLAIASAAYSDPAYKDAFYANLDADNLSRATNVLKAYRQLGFTDTEFRNYNMTLSTYEDKVAYSMGKRYIENADGSVDTLVALFIRGGNYGSEWTSNFHVGSGDDHIGFANAANRVTADIHRYVADLQENGQIKGDLKLWMTSYSRGAATTNLVAHNLNTLGVVGGVDFDIEDSYVYTFATPMGAYHPEKSDVDDTNIFNIISPLDFVPCVALDMWGYGRYGNTLVLPTDNVSSTFTQIEGVSGLYSVTTEQEMLIKFMVYVLLPSLVPDAEAYEAMLQSTVMYAFSLMNSGMNLEGEELIRSIVDYYFDKFEVSHSNVNFTIALLSIIAVIIGFAVGDMSIVGEALAEYLVEKLAVFGIVLSVAIVTAIILGILANIPGFAEGFANTVNVSGIANAHYSTYYMAALQECGYDSADDFAKQKKWLIGACPVDLNVYDNSGKLVASVVDNKVVVDEIPVSVIGDEKFVLLDDSEYSVEWIGNDDGEMDYTIYEFGKDGSLARMVNFYDLPLEDGKKYEQNVSADILNEEDNYSLYSDETEFESDYDTLLPKSEKHRIIMVDGISHVTEATAGETVTVYANRETESAFAMWYSDADVVFEDATLGVTSFIMPDRDVNIYAVYEEDFVSSIELDEAAVSMKVGESRTLNVTVDKEDAIVQNFEWLSSDSETVSVDDSGNIKALAIGQAVITVTETFSGISAQCIVNVESEPECPHDYRAVVMNPTCASGGYTTYTCKLCGEGFTADITQPVGHKNGIATCVSKAVCDVCGVEYGELNMENHASVTVTNAIEATCASPGLTEGKYCTLCETVIVSQEVVPAKEHNWIDKDSMTVICSVCGATMNVECRHEYASVVVKPTCTDAGYTKTTCKYCNDTNIFDEVSPLGHNYQNGVCVNCGHDKTAECDCNCHKGGIVGLFFKIVLLFQKIFKKNKECDCGINHY